MKRFLRIFNIPIPYMIAASVTAIVLISLKMQGTINLFELLIIASIGLIIASQFHFGSIVVKNLMGFIVNLYLVSLYTNLIMDTYGFVIQPFFLTLAGLSAFLAQTYSNQRNYELRSRTLWTTILCFMLITIKSTLILSDFGFWVSEVIGLNFLVIFIVAWRYWVNNSKKTRINEPFIIDEEIREKFKFIYIENGLDATKNEWRLTVPTNAYPWIYNEVMSAREKDLILVIASSCNNSKVYDLGEIELNKAVTIPYLYLESNNVENTDEILEEFIKDISKSKQYEEENEVE